MDRLSLIISLPIQMPHCSFSVVICGRCKRNGNAYELPCTTLAGVQAMARALATWDRELLRDTPAKDAGDFIAAHMVERLLALQQSDPSLDANLLSRRGEFLTAAALLDGIGLCGDVSDKESDAIADRDRDARTAIIDSGPARTRDGIALKAAAAMQLLRVVFNLDVAGDWPGLGEVAAWHVLSEIAGNAYVPPKYPARFSPYDQEPPRRSALDRPFAQYPLGGPDADLLAACSEFRASEVAFCAIYDDEARVLSDGECEILARPIAAGWNGMLDRMARYQATTAEGLAARALVLAQHSGIKPGTDSYPFAFQPEDAEDVTGRLLHMLLSDAVRMIGGPLPVLDADLLALRPEFDRLHALMIDYNKDLIPDGGTECADFDAISARIATAPPAVTTEGRAFQAAAAMHHLYYRLSEWEQGRSPAWAMLKGIAGDVYQSVEART